MLTAPCEPPADGLAVKYQVVDHCNLNCAWCDHLAPVKATWAVDVQRFTDDLRRLNALWPVRDLTIYGGEPLLHPRLPALVLAARLACPQASLCVETNGLLLRGAVPQRLAAALVHTGALLEVTEYPATVGPVDQVNRVHPGLAFHTPRLPGEGDGVKRLFRVGVHRAPMDDPVAKRTGCYVKANERTALCVRAGVAYPCPLAMCAPGHTPAPDVGVRIADVSPGDLRRLAEAPTPLCAWCTRPVYGQPWRRSSGTVDEWTAVDEVNDVGVSS